MPEPELRPLLDRLQSLPWSWDGKAAILQMKDADFNHWKQMEWIGFYFEFLCLHHLTPPLTTPGPAYGNVHFDAFYRIPWDLKAHTQTNAKGTEKHDVIINDQTAIQSAVQEYGRLGLIVAVGHAEFNDEDRAFQRWHSVLKGGRSKYERQRIQRGAKSRFRKMSIDIERFRLFMIDPTVLPRLGTYRQGRNANGSPRAPKYSLDLRRIDPIVEIHRPESSDRTSPY